MAAKSVSRPDAGDKADTLTPADTRAEKPYSDFPLFPHRTGRWAKKHCGQIVYFGKTTDGWQAAIERYKAWADNGYRFVVDTSALTVARLADHF